MKINLKIGALSVCILMTVNVACSQSILQLQQGKPASIRGLSVVDDHIAWISGSKGYIAITTDGGKTWDWQQVKGFEKADFRDIEAFSEKEAIIMSSGTPALVLKTTDGGVTWKQKYKNADTAYFFDAMDFADHDHGYILGDPIDNKFVLMETKDGGETWNMFQDRPDALFGEACFAASGTCLRANKSSLIITTGGTQSRELKLLNNQKTWQQKLLPFSGKKPSQGSFSVAIKDNTTIIVGGDYANDKRTDSVACYNLNSSKSDTFLFPDSGPAGFQSCVEYISGAIFLSTGTSGTNITKDNGKTWTKIGDVSFNVCRKAKHGKLVLLAGDKGKIGLLKL